MSEVRDELSDGEGTLDTALKAVAAGAAEVENRIAEMTQKMDAAMDKVKSRMAEYQGYVESRVGDAESRLEKIAGEGANTRREALESLSGKSTAIWVAVNERLEKQQEQVSKAMADVAAAIAEVSAALTGAGTTVESRCTDLEDPAAMLSASVPYMNGLIDKVKEAASNLTEVAVTWPH